MSHRVAQCHRMHEALTSELKEVERQIHEIAKNNDAVQRLQTIPAVGEKVAVMIYATVGDISRIPDARRFAAYAGLVPSVRQSGQTTMVGGITKEGSSRLRCVLVQAGHVSLARCHSAEDVGLVASHSGQAVIPL